MNVIDIVLVIIALLAFISGWRKGLISAVGGVIALVAGLAAARRYAPDLAVTLGGYWTEMDNKVVYIIAFAIVFVGADLLVSLLAWLVEKLVKTLLSGWVNRLFGAVLSVLIAAFIMSIVLNIYEFADKKHLLIPEKVIRSSALYKPVLDMAPTFIPELKSLYEDNFSIEKAVGGRKQQI